MAVNALNLTLAVTLAGQVSYPNDVAALTQSPTFRQAIQYGLGTTAGKCDTFFADTRTLAASASESLDLNGVLTDAAGGAIAAVDLVALIITADAANTNDVVVGGAASNGFASIFGDPTDKIVIRPGGLFVIAAGKDPCYAITPATGDLLKVANSAGVTGVTYTVIALLRSA